MSNERKEPRTDWEFSQRLSPAQTQARFGPTMPIQDEYTRIVDVYDNKGNFIESRTQYKYEDA